MSLVNVSIVGNVARQPEYFEFQNGKHKTTITVAIKAPTQAKTADDRWETEFYRVETWGKLAEIAARYLSKGSHFGASGRLVLDKWQDKSGRDRVTPVIKADQISLPPRLQAVQAQEAFTGGALPAQEPALVGEECGEDQFGEVPGFIAPDSGSQPNSSSAASPGPTPIVQLPPISKAQAARMARSEAARIARSSAPDEDDADPHWAEAADIQIAQSEFGGLVVPDSAGLGLTQ